jgi:hypothetical protein
MSLDLFQGEPLIRISTKHLRNEFPALLADKLRYCIVRIQNFLVQNVCLWVLKRQISAHHRI